MKLIAVMAHYDVDNQIDPYLDLILGKITRIAEKVIIVSTSNIDDTIIKNYTNIDLIVRDNVGYDFCSYKEGILSISDLNIYDRLLVLNDSFYCSPEFNLESILSKSEHFDIFSLTASRQFAYHLQSYFLVFNKRSFTSKWFFDFWNNIYYYKRKEKIIFDYEIELTNSALRNGLRTGSCYLPEHQNNPSHKDYQFLFKEYRFVKTDVLRNEIGELDISEIPNAGLLNNHVSRTKASYKDRLFKFSADNFIVAGNNFFEYTSYGDKYSKIAVILHLYYADLAQEFYHRLSLLPVDFDLFVTVTDEKYISLVKSKFRGLTNALSIAVVENRGRDVLPFIKTMTSYNFTQYEMVLKLHSKKSKYSTLGEKWRQDILESLIPSGPVILKLLESFTLDNAGIAASKKHYLSNEEYWGCNQTRVNNIMERLEVDEDNKQLFFIGGTMFWFKPEALYPLVNLLALDDFEKEEGQQDGTLAHVFERSTCIPLIANGYKCIDVNTRLTVDIADTYHTKVLVL